MKKFYVVVGFVLFSQITGFAQLSITTNTTQTQNFDGLPNTGTGLTQTGSIFNAGWSFLEAAANGNTTYQAGNGSGNTGDTYSFGTTAATDRAFGMLQSSSLTSILGFKFINNTGSPVTSIKIGYTGETWRLSPAADDLTFSYQAGNVALNAATGWTSVATLNFTTPTLGAAAAADGTSAANRTVISPVTILGLNIADGATFTVRWIDATGSSSAGMGVDDFSIQLVGAAGTSTISAGSGAEPSIISSLTNTPGAASLNFDFDYKDDGATPATDALATQISQFVIGQGTGNDITDWTQAIAGAELSDGTNIATATVNATDITFSSLPNATGQIGNIADDATKTYTLRIWLKASMGGALPAAIDGLNFAFVIQNSGISIAAGSGLVSSQSVQSGSTNNEVMVVATQLDFITQPVPTTINTSTNFTTPAVISARDINGNTDLGINGTVVISNTAAFTMVNAPTTFINGVLNFPANFQFTSGTGVTTIQTDYITDPAIAETASNPITLVAPIPSLIASPVSITGLTYIESSGPSVASSFTISGSSLTAGGGAITFTASAHYEVSTTSAVAGFGASATLDYTGTGTFAANTIWVRLQSGFTVGNYNMETIGITGGGVSSGVIATVSGNVTSSAPSVVSNASDYYRSNVTSGNWSAAASWESSPDNITWSNATLAPTSAAKTITIRNGHTIIVNSSITLDETIIEGTLETGVGAILNINDGPGPDISVLGSGVINVKNPNSETYTGVFLQTSPASINIASGGKIAILGNGVSVIVNAHFFATNPDNVWNNGAVFEWNCSVGTPGVGGVTYFPNVNASTIPIFRIIVQNNVNPLGGGAATVINGLLDVQTNITFAFAGAKTFRDGINGTNAIVTFSNGTTTISSSTAVLSGTLTLVLNQTLNLTNGVKVPTGSTVIIDKTSINNIAKNGGIFNVEANAVFDIGYSSMSNTSGSVMVSGTFRTGNVNGFTGAGSSLPTALGVVTLNTGCTVELNRYDGLAQVLTGRSDFKNLTFSGSGNKSFTSGFNPAGIVLIKNSAIVDAQNKTFGNAGTSLTMTGGRLRVSGASVKPDMEGIYNLTAGVIEYYNTGTVSNETINGEDDAGTAIQYNIIEVTGDKVANSNTNITLRSGGKFIVKNNGVFEINADAITGPAGTQTVTVENGGIFKCGDADGFSNGTGSTATSVHQNIETIDLQAGSTVEYSRSGNQVLTNLFNVSSPLVYQNLILSGTGNKTAPSAILEVKGNLTGSGTAVFVHNSGTTLMSGTAAQAYTASSPFIFYNFTNGNAIAMNIVSNMSVANALTLNSNGKLNLNGGFISLLSVATKTAYVAEVPSNASINYTGTGRFVVERYYPAKRSWRLITAPVTIAPEQSVFRAWQQGGGAFGTGAVGSGTYVTGPNPNLATNGLDDSPLDNYSLKTFNPVTGALDGVANTRAELISGTTGTAGIPDNKGFFMFVRGDRSINNPQAYNASGTVVETTLRDTGKIQLKNYTFNCTNVMNSYTLVGNPYPSPVNFATLNKTDIADQFWAWDPNLNTVGGYVMVDVSNSPTQITTVPVGGLTSQDEHIQSSQAFFVKTINTISPKLEFTETSKSNIDKPNLFRPLLIRPASLAINLFTVNTDGSSHIADGVLAQFSTEYADETDELDGVRFGNINETFGIISRGTNYMLQRRQPLTENDTIFLSLKKSRQLNYRFDIMAGELSDSNLQGYLEDNFLKTSTPIDMNGKVSVDFEVNSNAASADPARFRVVFRKAVHCTYVSATLVNSDVSVEWSLINETDIRNHEVERSVDGVHFSVIGAVDSKGNTTEAHYSLPDLQPATGSYYYRIKSTGLYGAVAYSETVKVKVVNSRGGMYVFPNPVTDGNINLQLNLNAAGIYRVKLLNAAGQEFLAQNISHAGGFTTHRIRPAQTLGKGAYMLEVTAPDKKKTVLKVLVQE